MPEDRREALRIIGSITATCAFPFPADELYGQHQGHAHEPPARLPEAPGFFTPAEYETVSRLADLIIPGGDSPGALDAGVPAYIDYVVSRNSQAQALYRRGLKWLDRQASRRGAPRFVDLPESAQVALLEPLCAEADAVRDAPAGSGLRRKSAPRRLEVSFFRAVKSMTADGYFTSRHGLIDALGYQGNAVLAEFPSCTHEH